MPAALSNVLQQPEAKHAANYLAKSILLVGAVFLLARTLPLMPAFCAGLLWALASALSAVGLVYHAVIHKAHRHLKLKEGGRLARLNSGRILSLIAGFVVSAICVAGLFLEAPKWGLVEWCLVVLSVPLFLAVNVVVGKWVRREYERPYQMSRIVLASCGIVGALLCILYAGLCLLRPAPEYASLAEAYLSTQQPFASSPSALLSEVGKLMALVDGLTAYGMAKAGQISFGGYLVWRCVLCASAFFGIANLLGMCALETAELKKAFLPLEASLADEPDCEDAVEDGNDSARFASEVVQARKASATCVGERSGEAIAIDGAAGARDGASYEGHSAIKSKYAFVRRFVAVAAVLPVCLLAAFCVADHEVGEAAQAEGFTAAESFVRDQIDLAVYLIDGKYYEQKAVEALLADAREKAEQLSDEAKAALVPLINESFDARIENVDGYLDWYYSLPADYERLARLVVGSAEQYATEQFTAKIDEGIDDSKIEEKLQSYAEQAQALQDGLTAQLAEYEVKDVPAWLLTVEDDVDLSSIVAKPLEPTKKLLDAPARLGVSAAAGIGAGIIAKRLVKKAITKAFYKQVVSKVAGTLSSKAAASVAGGAVGSVGGPVGTAAGVAIGAAASVGVDYVLLMVDEQLNRDSYREEIVATIEEGRQEMLSLVQ